MRKVAWICIIGGVLFGISNIIDEMNGTTEVSAPHAASHVTATMEHSVSKEDKKVFRGAMTYKWIYAGSILFLGVIMLNIASSQDKTEIFSVDPDDFEE